MAKYEIEKVIWWHWRVWSKSQQLIMISYRVREGT